MHIRKSQYGRTDHQQLALRFFSVVYTLQVSDLRNSRGSRTYVFTIDNVEPTSLILGGSYGVKAYLYAPIYHRERENNAINVAAKIPTKYYEKSARRPV